LDIWNFSEKISPLLGINIFGVPLEEFLFWFGAAVFFPLLYLAFNEIDQKLFPKKPRRRMVSCPPQRGENVSGH
jgi:hypothetical protein